MRRFSPAMMVALIALFVALGGTAVAAAPLITGAQIKDKSIGFNDISNTAVARLRGRVGPTGPEGSAGRDGPAGPAGVNGGFDPGKVTYVSGVSSALGPGQINGFQASCPAGTKAIAGGGFNSIGKIGGSGPSPDGSYWYILVYNDTSIMLDSVQAFAVCAAR